MISNKKGTFVFVNEARAVSPEQWQQEQPKVKFPDAEKKNLGVNDVIVHTPRASDVAKARAAARPTLAPGGVLPQSANGKPLNTDFETGSLQDWTSEGKAFEKQPVLGDTVLARRAPMTSNHTGKYWIGSYENGLGDGVTGTLSSKVFKVSQRWAAFLMTPGPYETTRVELVSAIDQKVLVSISGANRAQFGLPAGNSETLSPVVLDLEPHLGTEIFIRIVDLQNGKAWGHINFDDFKLYAEKPRLVTR